MNQGVLTLTKNGEILYANHRFAEMLKTSTEKVIGSTIETWVAPDDLHIFKSMLRKGSNGNHRKQIGLIASDGTLVPILLSVSHLLGNVMSVSFGLVATELTEQEYKEEIVVSGTLTPGIADFIQSIKY